MISIFSITYQVYSSVLNVFGLPSGIRATTAAPLNARESLLYQQSNLGPMHAKHVLQPSELHTQPSSVTFDTTCPN